MSDSALDTTLSPDVAGPKRDSNPAVTLTADRGEVTKFDECFASDQSLTSGPGNLGLPFLKDLNSLLIDSKIMAQLLNPIRTHL